MNGLEVSRNSCFTTSGENCQPGMAANRGPPQLALGKPRDNENEDSTTTEITHNNIQC